MELPKEKEARPASVHLLAGGLLFQGLSGIVGGVALVTDPTGGVVRISLSWLDGSPFGDYLIPGLILLTILGVFPLFALYGVWKRLRWGRHAAAVVGAALAVWIGVEILIIGYRPEPPLQLIYGLLGVGMIFLASLPPVSLHFKDNKRVG